jgi:hypothetical protein
MIKHRFNPRSALSLTALAACLMASTAYAGVLGGNAGLGGVAGPRSLDVSGQASAGATLPSGNKLRETAGSAKDKATQAKDATQEQATHAKAAAGEAAGKLSNTGTPRANASASGSAGVSRADRSVNASGDASVNR